jgi:cytidyltransferase-related domain
LGNKKYKIGYTTGVFDLFHIGHLNILKRAKDLCDYLIVGVSTDELVREYKHKKPVMSYFERSSIVEAIRYVDKVVPQTTMDKIQAFKELNFEVMFHGDDWKGTPLYDKYKKEFEKVGVKMVFLPHTPGISTTDVKESIQKGHS